MLKRFFLGIKIILIVSGFFLAANEYHGESWLMMGLFWLVTGVETAIRSYREKGKIPFSFNVVFVVAAAVLVTVGFITL
jgi:cadmium resistance protein CadD (predicted permease)